MKKKIKVFSAFCLTILLVIVTTVPVSANSSIVIFESNIDDLEPYIQVDGNQYVLELPDNVIISEETLSTVNESISKINQHIVFENLYINPETKSALQISGNQLSRAYGKNHITWRWNSFILYLDAGMLRLLATAGISALSPTFNLPVWAAVVVAGAFGAAGYLAGTIKHGMWIDVNHFGLAGCGIATLTLGAVGVAVHAMGDLAAGGRKVCGVSIGLQ